MEQCSKNETFIKIAVFLDSMLGVVEELFDSNKIAVLKVLVNSKEEWYLRELSRKSEVPVTTTFRVLEQLVSLGLVQKREMKTAKLYSMIKNERTAVLFNLLGERVDPLQIFGEKIKNVVGVRQVIVQGDVRQDGANVLVIGSGFDADAVKRIGEDIEKNTGFKVYSLGLTEDQYKQMSQMGFYPGPKKVLVG